MFDPAAPLNDVATNETAARNVLSACGLDPLRCRIERPVHAFGFSGALILRVQDGERTWCLRRWPPGGLSRDRLRALHHWLSHLKASRIAVLPQPATASSGDTLVEHQALLWQLEPWMPGNADFHQQPSDTRLRAAMRTLAAIHCAAAQYEAPREFRQWFDRHHAASSPACRERLAILRAWSVTRCNEVRACLVSTAPVEFCRLACDILHWFQFARRAVERELLALHDVSVPIHPCLRDIWHDHVLFTGHEVTGIVDPSAARSESVASDLSRLLGSLLGDDRPRWEIALGWYHDLRPLSSEELQLIHAFDHSAVLLSGLTWIDRCLQGQLSPEDMPRVLTRLEKIDERLAHLAATLSR